ncbi:hypothetical protein H6G41_33300 [Tolypothrix sp. FACHB-123]|uniref:HMA2 domain-containing protein n=1 Tax=Tolypothrix sp. FACHB-123 TaxID=2692868 RepID=UPI001684208F|nr:hypothetical protein [Tolypothrix sp. FACHB-123]MBD2359400.1 hypothetical protein [Tolypothrix sp. FACHB-123]
MTTTISSHNLSTPLNDHPDLTSEQHFCDEISAQEHGNQVVEQVKLQVIHAIAGRLRIRSNDGNWNCQIEQLCQDLKQQSWLLDIQHNQQRGSVIFTFDENQVSLPQVLKILTEFDVSYSPAVSKVDLTDFKSLGFWQKQSMAVIPLLAGLAVTRGLRVRGLPAILVYMLVADATRWVIDSVEPGLLLAVIAKTAEKFTEKEIPLRGFTKVANKSLQEIAKPGKLSYQVVHQIPGRIRFHVEQLTKDSAYGKKLESILKADGEVINFRVNYQASSVVINYHHSETSLDYWLHLLESALPPEIAPEILVSPPEAQPLTTPSAETNIELDLSKIWVDLKPSMMSYSLGLMANFPL